MADSTQSVQDEINKASGQSTSQPKDGKSDLTTPPSSTTPSQESAPATSFPKSEVSVSVKSDTSSNVQSGAELVDSLIKQTQPQGSSVSDNSNDSSTPRSPESPKGKKFSPMMLVGLVVLLITLPVLAFVLSGRDIVTLLPSRAGGNEGQPCSPGGAVECQSDGKKHWCDPSTLRWSGGGDSCSSPGVSCNISGYRCNGGKCYAQNALRNDGTCGDVESTLSNCPNSCQSAPPPPSCGGCEGGSIPNGYIGTCNPNQAGKQGFCTCNQWVYRYTAECPAPGQCVNCASCSPLGATQCINGRTESCVVENNACGGAKWCWRPGNTCLPTPVPTGSGGGGSCGNAALNTPTACANACNDSGFADCWCGGTESSPGFCGLDGFKQGKTCNAQFQACYGYQVSFGSCAVGGTNSSGICIKYCTNIRGLNDKQCGNTTRVCTYVGPENEQYSKLCPSGNGYNTYGWDGSCFKSPPANAIVSSYFCPGTASNPGNLNSGCQQNRTNSACFSTTPKCGVQQVDIDVPGGNPPHISRNILDTRGCAGPTSPPAPTSPPVTNPPQPTSPPPPPPTSTPIVGQCNNIRIYDAAGADITTAVVNRTAKIKTGDKLTLAVAGTNATQGRIRVITNATPNPAWQTTSTKNSKGEYTVEFTVPTGLTRLDIEAEVNISGSWR